MVVAVVVAVVVTVVVAVVVAVGESFEFEKFLNKKGLDFVKAFETTIKFLKFKF